MLNFIIWDIDPIAFKILGKSIRWYGLLFGLSFYLGYLLLDYLLKKKGFTPRQISKLAIFLTIGTILGLRLGHVFFYKPDYYFAHPEKILMFWKGGLASHGAAFGLILAVLIFIRKEKKPFFWLMDRIVIVILVIAPFIRIGNLMNSEIIGNNTTQPHAFIFVKEINNTLNKKFGKNIEQINISKTEKDTSVNNIFYKQLTLQIICKNNEVNEKNIQKMLHYYLIPQILTKPKLQNNIKVFEHQPKIKLRKQNNSIIAEMPIYGIPRHAAQLYEAFGYLIMFILFILFYIKRESVIKQGFMMGMFLIFVFTFRFFVEFLKEVQVPFENKMPLQMGQWLSVPFVIIGIILVLWSLKKDPTLTT